MSFNTSTGELSGTPTQVAAPTDYTVTAINATSSASRTFNLDVIGGTYTQFSGGKVGSSVTSTSVVGESTLFAQLFLDAPIICADPKTACAVSVYFTTSDSSVATFSTSSVTWSSTDWYTPKFVEIESHLAGLVGDSDTINLKGYVLSNSEYYNNYFASILQLTVNRYAPVIAVAPRGIPDPAQKSKITSFTPLTTSADSFTVISVQGNFIEAVKNISINGVNLPLDSWSQTSTLLTINVAKSSAKSLATIIYNGAVPVMQLDPIIVIPSPITHVALGRAKITHISCVKPGFRTRVVYGVNPTCGVGYIRK
jgi:hypothetical protein